MKKCFRCNDSVLYDNNIENCPVCGSRLSDYSLQKPRIEIVNVTGTVPVEPVRSEHSNRRPRFESIDGRTHTFTGTVSEVTSNARANNRLKKIVNVLFNGEPYQFGHTSHETVIRIEEITDNRFSMEKRDVYLYGDVEGRVFPGDYVSMDAREYRSRLVADAVESLETGTTIRPQGQISHGAATLIIVLSCLLIVSLLVLFVWLLASGKVINVLTALVGGILGVILSIIVALSPFILMIWILYSLLKLK